jgi:ribosomal-protein-alanine N-acetyltransferase
MGCADAEAMTIFSVGDTPPRSALPHAPRLALLGEEAELLAALHAQCFEVPWHESAFAGLLKSGGFGYALVTPINTPLAFILLRSAASETEILTLATHPAHQRKGLARQLLQHCYAELSAQGSEEIFLEVRADNLAAQALYVACGFTQIARRPNYYTLPNGTRSDALVLQKKLGQNLL